jgi:hypothetical protein
LGVANVELDRERGGRIDTVFIHAASVGCGTQQPPGGVQLEVEYGRIRQATGENGPGVATIRGTPDADVGAHVEVSRRVGIDYQSIVLDAQETGRYGRLRTAALLPRRAGRAAVPDVRVGAGTAEGDVDRIAARVGRIDGYAGHGHSGRNRDAATYGVERRAGPGRA